MTKRTASRIILALTPAALAAALVGCSAAAPAPRTTPLSSAADAPCAIRDLSLRQQRVDHPGMGKTTVDMTVTNTGTHACTVAGQPVVEFIDAQGSPIGAASKTGRPVSAVHLRPEKSAKFTIVVEDDGNFPACGATPSRGFRIYPEESADAVDVTDFTGTACSSLAVEQLSTTGMEVL